MCILPQRINVYNIHIYSFNQYRQARFYICAKLNAMKTSTTHLEDVKFNGRKKNCSKGFFSGFFYIPIVKLI